MGYNNKYACLTHRILRVNFVNVTEFFCVTPFHRSVNQILKEKVFMPRTGDHFASLMQDAKKIKKKLGPKIFLFLGSKIVLKNPS